MNKFKIIESATKLCGESMHNVAMRVFIERENTEDYIALDVWYNKRTRVFNRVESICSFTIDELAAAMQHIVDVIDKEI